MCVKCLASCLTSGNDQLMTGGIARFGAINEETVWILLLKMVSLMKSTFEQQSALNIL